MLRSVSMILPGSALSLSLWRQRAAGADRGAVKDEICVSWPRRAEREVPQPDVAQETRLPPPCHVGGAEHVADTRTRPKIGGDQKLCASCHQARKKHGSSG